MERRETNTETVKRVLDTAGIGYSLKIGKRCSFFFCRTMDGGRFNIKTDGGGMRIWKYAAMGVTGGMWVNLLDIFEEIHAKLPQMRMDLNEDLDVSWYIETEIDSEAQTAETIRRFSRTLSQFWPRLSAI